PRGALPAGLDPRRDLLEPAARDDDLTAMRLEEDLAELPRQLRFRAQLTPLEAVEGLLRLVPAAELGRHFGAVGQRVHLEGAIPCPPGRLGAVEERAERSGRVLLQGPQSDRPERPAPVAQTADLVGQLQDAAPEDRRLPVPAEDAVGGTF